MKNTRIMSAGISALMGLSLLAGCSSATNTSSAAASAANEGPITLTVWTPSEDQSADLGNWLDKELAAFQEAHPEWQIEFVKEVCPEGEVKDKLSKDAEAGADVFILANDNIPTLIQNGAIARLGGATLDQINEQNSATTINTVTVGDGVYGVPCAANTWFMFYDKRVFSADDVKSLDTMLEKGKVGFPLSNSWYIASFYAANGCTLFGADGLDEAAGIDFGGDKAVAVTNYLVDLAANPNFVDSNGLSASALTEGTINCLFSGEWDYAAVVEAIGEENVGVACAPTYTLDGEEKQLKAFAGSKAIGVNATSKNPQVAVALAAFLGSTQAQQDRYDLRKVSPVDKSIKIADSEMVQAIADTYDHASIVQPLNNTMGQYWGPAQSMGEELVNGTVTHENAAEKTEAMNTTMNTAAVE